MKNLFLPFVMMLIVITHTEFAQAELFFICNKNVPTISVTKKEIKKIFLGHTMAWTNKTGIVLVNQTKKDIVKEFTKDYLKMSPARYKSHFRKKMFTGGGQRPIALENDQKVIEYVSNTDGAVGYISTKIPIDKNNVKMLVVKKAS